MAIENSASLPVFSPTGSGRNSPSPRVARNTTEEALYKKDKGFRRYAAGVERALALWDAAQQEWADYISFLGRLLKALQANPSEIQVIPHSDVVALRLSQCLNPALPSGVHQKALEEVYLADLVKKDALARDLSLYFPGLSTVLSFASLSVRPLFMSILESYILTLEGAALRPALKAIILCVLPGLEDETSEDFERMVTALDKLRIAAKNQSAEIADANNDSGSSHFWQCFFLATITNLSRRQGALSFLVRRLPRFRSSSGTLPIEAEAAVSPEPGLLIRCFEAGLSDPQLLIQRGFLDLLVSHLPLDSPILQQSISKEDLERLVAAATGVVSRRDMGLNRRLWAWLLGPEPSSGPDGTEPTLSPTQEKSAAVDPSTFHADYFSQYGLQALTRSVMKMINRPSDLPIDRAKPFRICLSLMDRWEVGGMIVPEVFLPALQSIQSYNETASKDQVDEVMRSASNFFDGVDSGLIWGKLIHLVTSSLDSTSSSGPEALRRISLAKFVLARFNLKEEDMLIYHMPLMILSTLAILNSAFDDTGNKLKDEKEVLDVAFEIVDSLVQIVPDRALRDERVQEADLDSAVGIPRQQISSKILSFYEESQGNLDATEPPFTTAQVGQLILRESSRMFATSIRPEAHGISPEMPSKIVSNLLFKVQEPKALQEFDLVSIFQQCLPMEPQRNITPSFPCLSAITTALTALQTARSSRPFVRPSQLPDVVHPLVSSLWQYLSPLQPKYHVETVRCLLQLHDISSSDRMVEAAISSILVQEPSSSHGQNSIYEADDARRFAILWTHTMYDLSLQNEKRGSVSRRASGMGMPQQPSPEHGFEDLLTRPLLLLLDSLSEEGSDTCAFMRGWLQELPTLTKVFEVLANHIQSLRCLTTNTSAIADINPRSRPKSTQIDDTKECLYYLKHIFHILKHPSRHTWVTLADDPVSPKQETPPTKTSLQEWVVRVCMQALSITAGSETAILQELFRTSVGLIIQIYQSPFALSLRSLELEVPLMARLKVSKPSLQSLLLEATLSALKLRIVRPADEDQGGQNPSSQPTHRSRLSLVLDRSSLENEREPIPPPPQLVDCLKYGFSSHPSRLVLDDWVHFLVEVLPLFSDAIFQNLLPLVECFCKQITTTFDELKHTFGVNQLPGDTSPESTLISLINGLEQILAKAHDRLILQETKSTSNKSPEQPQGFFGNMVSGVFSSEANQARIPTANSRLTVLLCFQDTVRICFAIWSWGGYAPKSGSQDPTSASSFGYTSLRMRNRSRRILEHLFAAEALECLETLAVIWAQSTKDNLQATAVMDLLNVLNGSKPKYTIPAIFNAVYSRTNPNALDPNRMSTLTSNLSDTDLVSFLVDYTNSLEDDAMDEIWADCTVFLRDVLANPLLHRQILPSLLEFTAVIGQKVDNTNFGEQRRMRKELADIFTRILTAVFTTRSMGFLQDPSQMAAAEKASSSTNGGLGQKRAIDVVSILNAIVPRLPMILVENDRVTTVVSSISTNVLGPTFRAKAFPENVSQAILDLLYRLSRASQVNKAWKKDVFDAFNDPRFFHTPLHLLESSWLPILAQWAHSDKDRLPELLSRLSAPTTAGIMFGVGATSARHEADRKTQFTLRRIALLVLAAPEDTFTPNLPQVTEKVVELLTATPASSPSSTTRTEIITLIRALVLKTSPVHLLSLWPIISGELKSGLSSLLPEANNKENYNNASIIQVCKLLDQLVVLDPDDFQLMEWLFITDTIDAVYKPDTAYSTSLTDEISDILSASETPTLRTRNSITQPNTSSSNSDEPRRTLMLDPLIEVLEKEEGAGITDMARRELVDRLVRPFLGNLAMMSFEATYGGGMADWQAIWKSVVADARGNE